MAMFLSCAKTCSLFSALWPFPFSLKGHFPRFSSHRPHRCYLLSWPRRGAAKLKFGIPKGQLHVNQFCPLFCSDLLVLIFFSIGFKKRKGERNVDLLFHLHMHLFMCPNRASNQKPWHIRTSSNQLNYPARSDLLF